MTPGNANTGVSVIIPNRNNAERLRSCLRALQGQSFLLGSLEIIVADNASSDGAKNIVRDLGVKCIDVDDVINPYVARNRGISAASFRHIALLDSTCVPCPDYIRELWDTAISSEADLVVGNIEFELRQPVTTAQAVDALTFMRNRENLLHRQYFPGGSLFFTRELFEEVGAFREDLRSGADGEWTNRVVEQGKVIAYADKAIAKYPAKEWKDLLRKAVRVGRGDGKLKKENREFSIARTFIEMRPPSPEFLSQMIYERGIPDFNNKKARLWLGMWLFRVALGYGKLRGGVG